MRRGALAALRRLRYWGLAGDGDTEAVRQVRRDARLVKSELRSAFTDEEVDAALSCATYVEMAVKQIEYDSPKRAEFFTAHALKLREAVKRVMVERELQRMRTEREKK